jgi:hypothetical protein
MPMTYAMLSTYPPQVTVGALRYAGVMRFPMAAADRAVRLLTGSRLACWRYVRVHQRGRAGRTGDRVLGPLPKALQRLTIAERDSGFQACAGLHLGQIHDGIDQARPPARGNMPGRRMQRCPGGSADSLRCCHLGSGDCLITILDLDVPGRIRTSHGMPPEIACNHLTKRTRPIGLALALLPRSGLPGTHSSSAAAGAGPAPARDRPDETGRQCSMMMKDGAWCADVQVAAVIPGYARTSDRQQLTAVSDYSGAASVPAVRR